MFFSFLLYLIFHITVSRNVTWTHKRARKAVSLPRKGQKHFAENKLLHILSLLGKHRFLEWFLGAQTSKKHCFLAAQTKKHFTETSTFAHARFRRCKLSDTEIWPTLLLRCANEEAFVAEAKLSWSKTFGSKKCFHNKFCEMGKHLWKHVSASRLWGPLHLYRAGHVTA